jgi:hypothetical protein
MLNLYILTFSVFCLCVYLYCFVVIVVVCIFIFVCTSVGLLPSGENPIAVSNNNNNNNNNNSFASLRRTKDGQQRVFIVLSPGGGGGGLTHKSKHLVEHGIEGALTVYVLFISELRIFSYLQQTNKLTNQPTPWSSVLPRSSASQEILAFYVT